ncbi:MAG: signal recognition particle-docking protein FtsY [Methanocellales archaeon]|nr:signal recognition particle-docking protein FtsY [Methanocellales archaeon]
MFNDLKKTFGAFIEETKVFLIEREFIVDEKSLETPLWNLELALLEGDVALPVAEDIVQSVRTELLGTTRKWRTDLDEILKDALRKAIADVFTANCFDFDEYIEKVEKPENIVFVGVNGTGKTTTIAKIAHHLANGGYSVIMASGDTFRAGATEQIDKHAEQLGIKLIKHQHGADPAAVIYDAIQYAKARQKDIVLSDTAGRMHTNINLMDQLKKICRVTDPGLVIFVDEATAGNDAVERAKQFNDAIGINGSILTKVDVDAKGGAALSIAFITGKPILFLGTGQKYDDLSKFKPDWLLNRLFGG